MTDVSNMHASAKLLDAHCKNKPLQHKPIVYISWEITVLSRALFSGYHCLWDIIVIWDTCL